VKSLHDSAAFEWITKSLTSSSGSGASYSLHVSGLIPAVFEKYAKILHRLDGHYQNIDQPLAADEIAILGLPDCSVVRDLVVQKRRSSIAPRILWKDAANALGVPYAPELSHSWISSRLQPHPDCWPRFICGPAEGSLDANESGELVSLLAQVTAASLCFFRLAAIPYIGREQDLMFTGTLDQVVPFFIDGGFQFTPEYWWPSDRSWCVCSNYDFDFTIVGGYSELINRLLRSEVLECVEVGPETRVDSLVPVPGRDV
jgi:hypothetical protein